MVNLADIPYRIPVGIAYVWRPDGDASPDRLHEVAESQAAVVLGPGSICCLPKASNMDVIDAALRLANELVGDGFLSAMVFPGVVEHRGESLRLVSDGLVDDLRKQPPTPRQGSVLLTGHATRELETPWALSKAPSYSGPSGRSRTLWSAHGLSPVGPHYRNPRVLRLTSSWVRPSEATELEQALEGANHVRVVGNLGVGKSRLVAHALQGRPQLWARCWPQGSNGPSVCAQLFRHAHHASVGQRFQVPSALADEILNPWQRSLSQELEAQLLESLMQGLNDLQIKGAPDLVIDDLHAASPVDRAAVESLIGLENRRRPRLLTISRPCGWDERFASEKGITTVSLGPLGPANEARLADDLTDGLSIPKEAIDRFKQAAGGNPFAFEEGLHNLVRRRFLREHYGNFFFAGPKDLQYRPTARLGRHLLSEALRVDALEACLRLASAKGPVPTELLALSSDIADDRLDLLVAIGLLKEEVADGRSTLDFAQPAYRAGFRQCLEDHVVHRLRGELLQPMIGGGSAAQTWSTYQSLAGTPKGTEALLEVLALDREEQPKEGLFEALQRELLAHRDRQGNESTEFELLWVYLPLARKFAEPSSLIPAIERALALCGPADPRRTALLALHSEEALVQGELESAEQRAVEGLDLARKQDPRRQSLLLLQLGKVLQRQDRLPEAKRLLLDLLNSMSPAVNPSQTATCHYHLGNIHLREQDYENALEHHQQALKQRREQGSPTVLGHSLSALATLNLAIGNYSQSLVLYEEALDVLADAPDISERAFPLTGIGRTLSRLGDFAGATAPIREALELRKRRADKVGIEISKLALAKNDYDLGKIERSLQEARLALFRLIMVGSTRYRADAEALIGQLLLRSGKPKEALARLDEAAANHRRAGSEVDSLFDESFALEASIELRRAVGIERRGQLLAERLAVAPYPELGERLDLSLHRGWKTLAGMGERTGDAKVPLERAYRELCRKTAMLEPDRRNRFLLQVPANRQILRLAQEEGFADPSKLEKLLSQKQRPSQ